MALLHLLLLLLLLLTGLGSQTRQQQQADWPQQLAPAPLPHKVQVWPP
jgi:hypothetical protein